MKELTLAETPVAIENVGWTLGNECPFRCTHCYSMSARIKGKDLCKGDIDRIVNQLVINNIKTVNLGGNEPLYTNGANPRNTLLPYIIDALVDQGVVVGLTTAGVTINYLAKHYPRSFNLLNDVDVSFDSPYEEEHNKNRGASLFHVALEALEHCRAVGIDHTVVMCGMKWNLSEKHLIGLVKLAKDTGSYIRINFLKPTDINHFDSLPTPEQFYRAGLFLLEKCTPVDLGEPLLATGLSGTGNGCPCGVTSFRIHSITPDGKVPVSPCVYTHDFRVGDLLVDSLYDIIHSAQFRAFRIRHANPDKIAACNGCEYINTCRGGCAARAYYAGIGPRRKDLFIKDPYCLRDFGELTIKLPFDKNNSVKDTNKVLVHRNYLCTYILKPM